MKCEVILLVIVGLRCVTAMHGENFSTETHYPSVLYFGTSTLNTSFRL